MSIPRPLQKHPAAGAPVSARRLRSVWDAIGDMSQVSGESEQVVSPPLQAPALRWLRVDSFGTVPGDGIVFCKLESDAQGSPQLYTVYAPPTLYELARDGVSYVYVSFNERTATLAADSETQYVTPSLRAGDFLLCTVVGGFWRDLNVDGRQWAAEPT